MSFKCQYCEKDFKSKTYMIKHQLVTKKCISIQNGSTINNKEYNCIYCKKNFKTKQNLNIHFLTCFCKKEKENQIQIEELKKENEELKKENEKRIEELKKENEKQIQELKKENEKIIINFENQINEYKSKEIEFQNRFERITNRAIDKPSLYNTNNTKIISLQPFDLSKDYVTNKVMNKFNDNHILDGMSGIAKFVKDKIVTLEDGSLVYACFDTSRQMFKYKDKDGNVIKDPKSVKLIEMLQPALKEQTTNLVMNFLI